MSRSRVFPLLTHCFRLCGPGFSVPSPFLTFGGFLTLLSSKGPCSKVHFLKRPFLFKCFIQLYQKRALKLNQNYNSTPKLICLHQDFSIASGPSRTILFQNIHLQKEFSQNRPTLLLYFRNPRANAGPVNWTANPKRGFCPNFYYLSNPRKLCIGGKCLLFPYIRFPFIFLWVGAVVRGRFSAALSVLS